MKFKIRPFLTNGFKFCVESIYTLPFFHLEKNCKYHNSQLSHADLYDTLFISPTVIHKAVH